MHVSWFMYTLLRPVCVYCEHPPLGCFEQACRNHWHGHLCVCVCRVCVCVWGKVMSKGWKVVVLSYPLSLSSSSSNNNFTLFATRRWLNRKCALKGQFDSKSRVHLDCQAVSFGDMFALSAVTQLLEKNQTVPPLTISAHRKKREAGPRVDARFL